MLKNCNKGFTLIEMLVVVLIIGILAAIALPQYRKSVAKAELAQIIPIVKGLKQAEDRYYLINDQYTTDLGALDVGFENSNINCKTGASPYNSVNCYNKNFNLWRYVGFNWLECAAKTTDPNSPLAYACREFLGTENCSVCSGCGSCDAIGGAPCFVCGTNGIPIS